MHEFAFDVKLQAVARVRAASLTRAIEDLRALAAIDLNVAHGPVRLTEATVLAGEAELFELDGNAVGGPRRCARCGRPVRPLGGRWLDDGDDHPERCPSGTAGEGHAVEGFPTGS